MPYSMTVAPPMAYWDPAHRPGHFAQFVATAEEDEVDAQDVFA